MSFFPVLNIQAAYKSDLLAIALKSEKYKILTSSKPLDVAALSEFLNYDFDVTAADVVHLDQTLILLDKLDADILKNLDSVIIPIEYVKFINLFV